MTSEMVEEKMEDFCFLRNYNIIRLNYSHQFLEIEPQSELRVCRMKLDINR